MLFCDGEKAGAAASAIVKKWIRRIFYAAAGLVIVAAIALYVLYRLSSATPHWYQPLKLSDDQIRQAARLAVEKGVTLREQAQDARIAEARSREAAAEPAHGRTIEVSFTNDELNAFFQEWTKPQGRDKQIAQYVNNPQIILLDNELILAGTVKGIKKFEGRVASVHFTPKL